MKDSGVEWLGETTEYDKKLSLEIKRPKSWCKTVSAFANGNGGKLIFGISDNDELVGLSDAEADAEKISEIVKTRLNPIPDVDLSIKKVEGKKLIVLEIFSGKQTPYYYDGDGQLIAFVRIGNESVPAQPQKLQELVLKGTNQSYDSLPSKYDFDNLSFTKLKAVYYQRTKTEFLESDFE